MWYTYFYYKKACRCETSDVLGLIWCQIQKLARSLIKCLSHRLWENVEVYYISKPRFLTCFISFVYICNNPRDTGYILNAGVLFERKGKNNLTFSCNLRQIKLLHRIFIYLFIYYELYALLFIGGLNHIGYYCFE